MSLTLPIAVIYYLSFDVLSDEKDFHVIFKREIFENDKLVRQREWQETIPRNFQ